MDRLASRLVVGGGVLIIASILAILVVIIGEAYPLFLPARAELVGTRSPGPGAVSAPNVGPIGTDEYREIAYHVTADGQLPMMSVTSGASRGALAIPGLNGARVTTVAARNGGRHALGTSDGRVVPAEVVVEAVFEDGRRVMKPRVTFGEATVLDPGRRAIQRITFAAPASGTITVAQLGPRELVAQMVRERKGLVGGTTREKLMVPLSVDSDGEVTALAIDGRGDDLFVGTSLGRVLRYDMRDRPTLRLAESPLAATGPAMAITEIGFLNGDRSLVIGDAAGGVATWQLVGLPGRGEPSLTRVNHFEGHPGPVIAFSASGRDKGFATGDSTGLIRVHYATSGRTLLALHAGGRDLRSIVIAPKADGLLALSGDGTLTHWTLDTRHPEITLRTLFGKVWYEGYAEPDHVWQSHGGTDDFEAKYSLTPLAFGTLKGTIYALFVAGPLALLAALYVSEFMHPDLRAYIKPVVEVMAALPSVVLGFIAGLWLAPMVERVVPGVFLLPPIVAASILGALVLWRRLPAALRARVRPGTEVFVLLPLVVGGAALALWLGGLAERALLGGDYRGWLLSALGLTYDQRNSLVVGIAMGFAVIPIIFTIAEDSLANVPQHLRAGSLALGATPWQTALRVVLPTASPGIFSAIMIGFGRAVGETMIVLMATGNTPVMDWSIFNGFRALSATIAVELPEAPQGHTHFRVLFLAAFLLFCLTFVINTAAEMVRLRLRQRYRYL